MYSTVIDTNYFFVHKQKKYILKYNLIFYEFAQKFISWKFGKSQIMDIHASKLPRPHFCFMPYIYKYYNNVYMYINCLGKQFSYCL